MSVILTILFIFTIEYYGCFGYVSVVKLSSNHMENIFEDADALFGSRISPNNPVTGLIFLGNPLNGCAPSIPYPRNASSKLPFIALVKGGGCSFVDKAMAAQRGNFSAVVVYNHEDDSVFPMPAVSEKPVYIHAVMVGLSDGLKIQHHYCYPDSQDYVIIITSIRKINIKSLIIFIVCCVGLFLICTIVYWGFHYYARHRLRPKRCLTQAQLNTIPVITFVEDGTSESTCPICLEEFVNQDQLRLLPCKHVYHCRCIDHWLLTGQRVCPVCKRPTHGRRSRRQQAPRPSPLLAGSSTVAEEATNLETGESEFEDDEADNPRRPRPQPVGVRQNDAVTAVIAAPPSSIDEVNETTPLLADAGRRQSTSGWRWFWWKNRRKSFITGWLNSNPFPSQASGLEPQPSSSSREAEPPHVSDDVPVPVPVSNGCSSPQTSILQHS